MDSVARIERGTALLVDVYGVVLVCALVVTVFVRTECFLIATALSCVPLCRQVLFLALLLTPPPVVALYLQLTSCQFSTIMHVHVRPCGYIRPGAGQTADHQGQD